MDKEEARRVAFEHAVKFIEYIRQNGYNPCRAYLFGSYATGGVHQDSDIDLAIELAGGKDADFLTQQDLMRLAARFFDPRIEPHPFTRSDLDEGLPFLDRISRTWVPITV